MKIIFIGTPDFGAIILKELVESDNKPVLIVTEPDKPVGRKQVITPPPVKILADKYEIPILQPEKIGNCKLEIENLKPDLGIVAAYGQIIPKSILTIPKYGFLNVHPSLLPKYRGASPIQNAILDGDHETGVTIMLMDEKLDHGPIIATKRLNIGDENFTYQELHDKLTEIGAKLLVDTIPKWVNRESKPVPQEEKNATYTRSFRREDGRIDWKKSAEDLERQIRAFSLWPGSSTDCGDNKFKIGRIKIWKARVKKQTEHGPFGEPGKTYLATNEQIAVQTEKDFLIIEELQPEGGKKMSSEDFLKGHYDFIGTILK